MKLPSSLAFSLAIAVALCQAAHAGITIQTGGTDSYYFWSQTQIQDAKQSVTSPSYAFANSQTGTLRAVGGAGTATIFEQFSFVGTMGGVAYLDWTLEGSATASGANQRASGQLLLAHSTLSSAQQEHYYLINNPLAEQLGFNPCPANAIVCVRGDSIDISGSLAIPITADTQNLQLTLQAGGDYGGIADLGSSAHFYLRLPSGVTISSLSTGFLALATPLIDDGSPSQVSEPASHALFAVGLMAMLVRRQRSQGRMAATPS
jgi:hypothetical protein